MIPRLFEARLCGASQDQEYRLGFNTNLKSGIIIEGYIFEIKNQTQIVREIFYELRNISFIDTVS